MIASDTPGALKASLSGDWIEVVVRAPDALDAAVELLARIAGAAPEVDADERRVSAPVGDRMAAVSAVVHGLGDRAEDIALRRPTLDEVFLSLTEVTP